MRIERLDVFTFGVPFKTVVRHASASRRRARNLIVAARGPGGATGWGEGCPRPYVTGETVESASAFVHGHRNDVTRNVTDIGSLHGWIDEHRAAIDSSPAAFCAMETAVVDLIGKVAGRTAEDVLGEARPTGEFRYTAVLGDSPWPVYRWQCRRYRADGFRDFKVKVSGDLRRDRRKMRALPDQRAASAHEGPRVRIDANNLWTAADECVHHVKGLGRELLAVEEPLRPGDLDGLRRVSDACGTRIVLDESLLRAGQLDSVAADSDRWIANIRVSKMGGVIRSLEVARRATDLGIGVIVGCQVGETSILARTALTVMGAVGPSLVAAEGAFGTHLLHHDLTSHSIMFGPAGVLSAADVPDSGSGYGLAIDERAGRGLEPLDP